jgi:hypothetical protein
MCFSAEASFTVGAALLPVGVYCIREALRKQPYHIGLALIPVWFGLQQISEGLVWEGLEHGNTSLTRIASLVFLFFALALWPFWFSFLGAIGEPIPKRRRWFVVFSLVSTVWFWVLYFPLLTGPESLLETRIVHHSIQYYFPDIPIHHYLPKIVIRLLYLASVAVPMVAGTVDWGRLPGIILGGLAIITFLVFDHAFVSVWCFFAAFLSAHVALLMYRVPEPEHSKSRMIEKELGITERSAASESTGL